MAAIPPSPQNSPDGAQRVHDTSDHHSQVDSSAEKASIATAPLSTTARSSRRRTARPSSTAPEVISSLISSFSYVSTEDARQSQSDRHPETTSLSLPRSPRTDLSSAPHKSGKKRGPRQLAGERSASTATASSTLAAAAVVQAVAGPDHDAAIAPVIRTSKPPSGYSLVTAPSRTSSSLRLPVRWPRSSSSAASTPSAQAIASPQEARSTSSLEHHSRGFGAISIESSPSQSNLSSYQTSRLRRMSLPQAGEAPRSPAQSEIVSESSKGVDQKEDLSRRSESNTLHPSTSDSFFDESGLAIIPQGLEVSHESGAFSLDHTSASSSPTSNRAKGKAPRKAKEDSTNIAQCIPARDSSLRHQHPLTPPRKRGKARLNNPKRSASSPLATSSSAMPHELDSTPTSSLKDSGDQAMRRIEELKAQKALRQQTQADEAALRPRKTSPPDSPAPQQPEAMSSSPNIPLNEIPDSQKENRSPSLTMGLTKRNSLLRVKQSPSATKHGRAVSNPIFGSPGRGSTQEERPSLSDSVDGAVDMFLKAPRFSQTVTDVTGRRIAFAEVGDPNGSVVLCCVGMGTTRFITAFYDELATSLKLRLITLDRPGIGDSEAVSGGLDTPLAWSDDVKLVCETLKISRFSILAHSAGAIYALALAIRMPSHVRGRVHLLAPWIPPSQMTLLGLSPGKAGAPPSTSLPYSQRLLRSLPAPFLKAANTNFFTTTCTSITSLPKRSGRRSTPNKNRHSMVETDGSPYTTGSYSPSTKSCATPPNLTPEDVSADIRRTGAPRAPASRAGTSSLSSPSNAWPAARRAEYETCLTQAIWDLATARANPAVDLMVCLERRQPIGFRYADVTQAVVIRHGEKDSRVPPENVRWLGKTMRRCEVQLLPDEGHGLMASGAVMGSVLAEMAQEWTSWNAMTSRRHRDR